MISRKSQSYDSKHRLVKMQYSNKITVLMYIAIVRRKYFLSQD